MRNKLMLGTALLLAGFGTALAQNNAGTQGNTRQPAAQQNQEHSGQAPSAQRNSSGEERRGAQSGDRRETTGQAPSAGKGENRSPEAEKNATESGRNSSGGTNTPNKSQERNNQGAARDGQQPNQNVGQEERRNSQQEINPRTGQQQPHTGQQEPRTGQQETGPRTGQKEGSERNGQGGERANNQGGDRNASGQTGQNDREPRNGSVTLNSEQQKRIRETVLSGRNVPRADNVTFAIDVGSRVPADIRIVEVPTALIDIHPEWRSDTYFVVRDEIVIVDGSRNIVATVPVGSSNAQLENRGGRTSVNLSGTEIREIQTELRRQGFEIEIDGVLGGRTRDAIIAFQKRSGFQATGEIDRDTLSALNEKKGDTGPGGQRNDRGGQQGNADTGRGENPSRSPSQAQTSNPRNNSNASSQNPSSKDAPIDRENSTTGQGNAGERNAPASQNQRRNDNQR
jgi:peptidoglycan hydrolase-like protein with peptidoglycan-binding domain